MKRTKVVGKRGRSYSELKVSLSTRKFFVALITGECSRMDLLPVARGWLSVATRASGC